MKNFREDINRIFENYDDLEWWRDRLKCRGGAMISILLYGNEGINYPEQDWDNLIVLDACRADIFEEVFDLSEFSNYTRKTSNASLTSEWVKKNFSEGEYSDTVYVSSNPFVSMHAGGRFHKISELWWDEFDETNNTVMPATVSESTLEFHQKYPDKRIIAHYMQPHWPFIESDIGRSPAGSLDIIGRQETDTNAPSPNPFKGIEAGHNSVQEVWDAYRNNLEIVKKDALRVADELNGKTVITSDHGNLFGEVLHPSIPVKFFGHPTRGLRIPELVQVPWAVIDGERRQIVEGSLSTRDDANEEIVEDRLKHLGYI